MAPLAQLFRDFGTPSDGEDEIDEDGVRRLHRRDGNAVHTGARRNPLVACAPQVRSQRAPDLGLVVDDEDPLRAHRCTGTGVAASGNATMNVAPEPSSDSAHSWPPFASANPRAIARPRPVPASPPMRSNGSKMRSSSVFVSPGPRSVTRIRTSLGVLSTPTLTESVGDENLRAFSIRF